MYINIPSRLFYLKSKGSIQGEWIPWELVTALWELNELMEIAAISYISFLGKVFKL